MVAVSGQTELEQPRATELRQCVHVQMGPCAQDELSGKAPKPAQEPAQAGPHDKWAHPDVQTETGALGFQRPAGVNLTAVGHQAASRCESRTAQEWV